MFGRFAGAAYWPLEHVSGRAALVIQAVMRWYGDHLRGFTVDDRRYGDMVIGDAEDDGEQLSAFLTVLEEELDLPTQVTVLGNPVTVLEFDYVNTLRGSFAMCNGARGISDVTLVDICFASGTSAAWVHAADRHFLGAEPFAAAPPWTGNRPTT